MFTKVLTILALLGAGIFCVYKMVTVHPHRLKKEKTYYIAFRNDLPTVELPEELGCFRASRSNLVGTVLFGLFALFILFSGRWLHDMSYFFFLFPLTLVPFHTLEEGTKKITIQPNGILVKSVLRKKFYPYSELDYLMSYNVLNAFHKGVSYGYQFVKDDKRVISMDIRQYPQIAHIETIFDNLPDIIKPEIDWEFDEDGWAV